MNIHSELQVFLSEKIEPKLENAKIQREHERVRGILVQIFGEDLANHFLIGSYKRNILTKRLKKGEKYDVDIMIVFNKNKYTSKDLPELLNETYAAALTVQKIINEEDEKQSIQEVRIQKTSIGILYDDNFKIDLVPAVEIQNGAKYRIYDTRNKKTVVTNPQKHNEIITVANDYTEGNLVPLIKLIKRWKEENCRDTFKSFHLSSIAIDHFASNKIPSYIVGLRDFFEQAHIVTSKSEKVIDPANSNNDISSYLDEEEIREFAIKEIVYALNTTQQVIDAVTNGKDEVAIQTLGKLYSHFKRKETKYSDIELDDFSHRAVPPWKMNLTDNDNLQVTAKLYFGRQNVNFWVPLKDLISDGPDIYDDFRIKYQANTVLIEKPYDIYWQIVNTGEHARGVGGLRGKIFEPCDEPKIKRERTEYTGKHWVECFVVRGDTCVARKMFFINVKNRRR